MKQSIKKMLFCTLLLLNFDASAHHSTVVFDEGKTELITGEVTRFVLRNPHMILSVDVPDEDGEAVLWKLEGQGIGAMQAMGFDRDSITAGDIITVKISPLKNGRPGGLVLGLIGADGRAYNMEIEEEDVRQVYPALMTYVPPPCRRNLAESGKKKRARLNYLLFPRALLREKTLLMAKPWEHWTRIIWQKRVHRLLLI